MAEHKTSRSVCLMLVLLLGIGLLVSTSVMACGKGPKIITETKTYSIEAGEKRVTSIVLKKGDRLDITVTVQSNDIGVQVDDPSGQAVVPFTRVESGDFVVNAEETGTYVLAFDNSYSFMTPKNITVDLEYPQR